MHALLSAPETTANHCQQPQTTANNALPPPPLGLLLLAPITHFSDTVADRAQPIVATLAESRRQGLTHAAQKAMQHPGQAWALFQMVDAFCCPPDQAPSTAESPPPSSPSRSTRRLLQALKDYLGAPPRDSTPELRRQSTQLLQLLQ